MVSSLLSCLLTNVTVCDLGLVTQTEDIYASAPCSEHKHTSSHSPASHPTGANHVPYCHSDLVLTPSPAIGNICTRKLHLVLLFLD